MIKNRNGKYRRRTRETRSSGYMYNGHISTTIVHVQETTEKRMPRFLRRRERIYDLRSRVLTSH